MGKEQLTGLFRSTINISQQKAEEIAEFFQPKDLMKGDFFLKEGQVNNEYLFLENGFMRAFAIDTIGLEIVTNFYSPNQLVFEVSSYFNRIKSKENIQAMTDCSGYFLNYQELNDLFHAVPEFREFGRAVLVKGFSAFKNRTLSMITESAEERYAGLINGNPEIFQHAPLKYIASYLGITDTSLSRIRKEFAKK
jgi:CRP-like cAMP-binding protein